MKGRLEYVLEKAAEMAFYAFIDVVIVAAVIAFAQKCSGAEPVTNDLKRTVMTVDQNGKLNVEGIATVQDVATNAVKVQVAQAAANAARSVAQSVTNELNGICESIVAGAAVIYRSGFSEGFEGLVVFTDDDKLAITKFTPNGISGGILSATINYVVTKDVGTLKPTVYAHDSFAGGVEGFVQVADSGVTNPVYHQGETVWQDLTFAGYYTITVSIPVTGGASQYFYLIKMGGDIPSGEGSEIELTDGVVDGLTIDLPMGDGTHVHFVKGVARSHD